MNIYRAENIHQHSPHSPDPDPCEALRCDRRAEHIHECRKAGCGFEWARTSREDRARREEKDRRNESMQEKEN